MKTKFKQKIISFTIIAAFIISALSIPVYATEATESTETTASTESTSTSETTKPAPEVKTTVTIVGKNTDTNQRVDTAQFQVKNSSGNILSFNLIATGEYAYSTSGTTKVLSADSKGKVKITNLGTGSYTVVDGGTESKYVSSGSATFTLSTLNDTIEVPMEYYSNAGSLILTFLDGDDNSVIPKGRFVLKDSLGNLIEISYTSDSTYVYTSNKSNAGEFITNSAGKATVTNIPAGNYTIEQVYAPSNYNSGFVTQDITISARETTNVTLKNTKEYGNLIITFDSSVDISKISSYEFKIADKDGYAITLTEQSDNNYAYYKSSANTSLKVKSNNHKVTVAGLPAGSYVLHQVAGPEGYVNIADTAFTIIKNENAEIALAPVRAVGSISIKKSDATTNEGLKGFGISLIDNITGNTMSFVKNSSGVYEYTTQANAETILETDESGNILATGLPTGKISVKEVYAAEGYMYSRELVEQTITTGTETVYKSSAQKSNCFLEFVNEDGEAIPGVAIKIRNTRDEIVLERKSDSYGRIIMSSLNTGTYIYEVVGVPSTYALPQAKKEFTVNEKGVSSGLSAIQISYNRIEIYVSSDAVSSVKDLEINLVSSNGEVFSAITDSKGIAVISKIPYGTYTLKQITEIEGYVTEESYNNILVDDKFENGSKYSFNIKVDEDYLARLAAQAEQERLAKQKKILTIAIVVLAFLVLSAINIIVYLLLKRKDEKNSEQYYEDDQYVDYDDGYEEQYEEPYNESYDNNNYYDDNSNVVLFDEDDNLENKIIASTNEQLAEIDETAPSEDVEETQESEELPSIDEELTEEVSEALKEVNAEESIYDDESAFVERSTTSDNIVSDSTPVGEVDKESSAESDTKITED